MDRVFIVGVLFFGFAHPVCYGYQVSPGSSYPYYDRPTPGPLAPVPWPRPYPYLDPTNKPPCEINWLEKTNCSVEITCTNATYVGLHDLRRTLYSTSMWITADCVKEDSEEDEEIYEMKLKHHIHLKLIGTLPINLEINDNDSNLIRNIKYISLKDNPIDVPQELNKFTSLEVIEINNYNISIFNVTKFMEFKELIKLNVSHSSIKGIEFNDRINMSSYSSKLEILDLSHNFIESLEDFRKFEFAQLKYLDLSYNSIKHIDRLCFYRLQNLRNLYLSHNHIVEILSSFINLNNIEVVTLDHNEITEIKDFNFVTVNKIKKLNLSTNAIQVIDDQAFSNLVQLKELDLSNNHITTIQKNIFRKNFELCSLSLRNNSIEDIEFEAFEGKNFTKFDIHHNILGGSIDRSFQSINVQNLDLSEMFITSIDQLAFSNAIRNLNLSHNFINSIAPLAFSESKFVNILDLSYNRLHRLNITFSSMKELSSLYLQNNNIEVLNQTTLKNLTSLTELDLSENSYVSIESKSFVDLKKLEILLLSNNRFMRNFENGTFDGLVNLAYLDFANSGITVLQNELFSDLRQLEVFNASHCEIEKIELNAFRNLFWIDSIDLSHNFLSEFLVNNEEIGQLKILYLSFNKIDRIYDNTFKGLTRLLFLDLSNNNIVQIGDSAFNSLKQLEFLNLGSNTDLEIKSSTLSNLSLKGLILRNVTKSFNFEHTLNTKISLLDLSSCNIDDIDSIYIYKLNVEDLRLNSNQIKKLDKHSFSNITSLQFLDITSNAISYIQPGTFLQLVNLKTLNLHDNDIEKLELGAFEGLKNLQTLNLSNNEITSFKHLNVRNLPALKTVSLDNNKIDDITFMQFSETGITKMTIGGNKIPCSQLTDYDHRIKYYPPSYTKLVVTAEILNFHSENVDGITCSQDPENDKVQTNDSINATYTLANAIEKLQETIKLNNNITGYEEMKTINNTLQKPIVEYINGIFEKQYNKSVKDLKSINNTNNVQNEHSDIKSLVNITVACLVFLVVICLTMFVPKVIKNISLLRFRRPQRGIPLINTSVEIE